MLISEIYRNVKRHPSKLINFQPKIHGEENNGYYRFWNEVLEDFLHVSTVQGVDRIFRRASKAIERFLWSFGFITALVILSYVTWKIAYICRHKPLETVISDLQLPVYKIPFPEITICNKNRLNWQRYTEAKDKFMLPQHHTPQHEQVFVETLNAYDTLQFGKFDNFRNLSDLYPTLMLHDLNYINFTLVVELMAWRCHEIFTDCSWVNRSYDCCEIFSARKSQQGLCLAFNSIETEEGRRKAKSDHYYPWRTLGTGPQHGLTVRVHTREEFHSPLSHGGKGMMLMMVEPSVWSYLPHEIPTNTRAMVSLSAYLRLFHEYTRMFPPNVRKCVFEDELESISYKSLQNHKYMFENCQSECQQEYLLKFCNCTVDMFYPTGSYRACRLTDLPCLYQHNEALQFFEQVGEQDYVKFLQRGMDCPCHFNCKSLRYIPDFHVEYTPKLNVDPNNTEIEMVVYFLWDKIMVYQTTAVYPFIDLIASVGGLASLCIGCSLVGITELLYFLCFDIPKQGWLCLKGPKRLQKKRESLKTRHIFVRERSIP